VQGGDVLLEGDQGKLPGCQNLVQCGGYLLRSLGLNNSFIDGRRIMLVTDFVQSFTGFPISVREVHSIFDNTTPAPLAPGAPAELPPELQEDDVPVASAAPPQLPFSISAFGVSGQPLALPYAFTIQSRFPRAWTLWHVGPPALSEDLTNGQPPAVTVAPAGGGWTTPTLSIALTLTGAFAASLSPGEHTFVLAAINHRGLSAAAQATLKVSP
jgi:hypothetical protein